MVIRRTFIAGLLVAAASSAAAMSLGLGLGIDTQRSAGGSVLDGFTQPAAAYSFRKLRTAYTGPAMRIIRLSDNLELDVGFTASGDFNAAPALAHCLAVACQIMTIYDQSGNGRHATNAVAGNRPYFAGSCGVTGGLCSSSTWAGIGLISASYTWAAGLTSMSAVARRTSGAGGCGFAGKSLNSIGSTGTPNDWWAVAYQGGEVHGYAADGAWHVASAVINGASSFIRIDGVETLGNVISDPAAGTVGFNYGAASTVCDQVEMIVWDNYTITPAERVALENNQKNYWTPYALDNFAAPAGAYSMRRLRSAYTGPAIKIFRASDSAHTDINFLGFVPGLGAPIDTAAINTFCASTSCSLEAWYDQSGNGRDAWHDGNPPLLVQNCLGSLPCAQASVNGQRVLYLAGSFVAKSSVSTVGKRASGTNQCYFIQKTNNVIGADTANNWFATDFTSASYQMPANDNVWHAGMAVTPTGVAATGRIDATETVGPALTGSAGANIIVMSTNTGTVCQTTEGIVWDNYALTAGERTALQTNQKSFWGTP